MVAGNGEQVGWQETRIMINLSLSFRSFILSVVYNRWTVSTFLVCPMHLEFFLFRAVCERLFHLFPGAVKYCDH